MAEIQSVRSHLAIGTPSLRLLPQVSCRLDQPTKLDQFAPCIGLGEATAHGANLSHGRLPKSTGAARPSYAVSPGGTIWGGERLSGASGS